MEQRITSLLLPAPEAELEASCKELDEKVTWLLHNSRKMDNYLELEPFSKDGRLCAHVCDTLKSLPETPTLAAYKDYKAIIILLGMSTTHYAILDELAEHPNVNTPARTSAVILRAIPLLFAERFVSVSFNSFFTNISSLIVVSLHASL